MDKDFFKIRLIFTPLIFIFSTFIFTAGCEKYETTKSTTPSEDSISTTENETPLNDIVKKAHDAHKKACPKKSLAGFKIYNKTYELMEWIESKRGLEFKSFPAICTLSQKEMEKLQSQLENAPQNSYADLETLLSQPAKNETGPFSARSITGFYLDSKNMILVEKDNSLQTMVLVHELCHALQDAYYTVAKFKYPPNKLISIDEHNARIAILEGEANLLEYLYQSEIKKKDLLRVENVLATIEEGLKDYEGSNAEIGLKLADNFHYLVSMSFILSLSNDKYDPKVIESLFESPPNNTDQVFFPQKYLDGKSFYTFDQFNTRIFDGFFAKYKFKSSDNKTLSLGKFGFSSMVKNHVSASDIFLKDLGWNGDRVLVYSKNPSDKHNPDNSVFVYLGKWDSEGDAYNFARYLQDMVNEKYKDFSEFENILTSDDTWEYSHATDSNKKVVIIKVWEDKTVFIEGLPAKIFSDFPFIEDEIFGFLGEDPIT